MTGTLLAIDPSSGSRESQPGFALFSKGKLVDAGTIQVTPGDDIHRRLFELRRSLMEDFTVPDVLVTELIPPFMNTGFNRSILNLHYSVGVVLSVFYCPTIRIPPTVWRRHVDESYIKSDRNDAIMLGYTVIDYLCTQYEVTNTIDLSIVRRKD